MKKTNEKKKTRLRRAWEKKRIVLNEKHFGFGTTFPKNEYHETNGRI